MTVSFWELPGLIEVAEKAGLSASRFRVQYEILLSRPLLLMVTVLLAATVSLRSFRGGWDTDYGNLGCLGDLAFFSSRKSLGNWNCWARSAIVAVWFPVCCGVLWVVDGAAPSGGRLS